MVIVNNSALKREARIRCTSLAPHHRCCWAQSTYHARTKDLLIRILVGPTQYDGLSLVYYEGKCVG